MAKLNWQPGTLLAPLPPALITSGTMKNPNIMTAAWTGIICSDPVLTYVSLRPSRYTHELVSKNMEFVINVPTVKIAEAVDTVGVKSGRDGDKFALTGLTPEACKIVNAPQIKECPIALECKVKEIRPFGTHDMFLAEVVNVCVDADYVDENGALDLEHAGLLTYAHGFYYALGRQIGKFGFSVEKKRKKRNASAPSDMTILKADAKFGKTERKFKKAKEEYKTESGVEVTVRRARRLKQSRPEKQHNTAPKTTRKFADKAKKKTNIAQHSYKKKSDGSFKTYRGKK